MENRSRWEQGEQEMENGTVGTGDGEQGMVEIGGTGDGEQGMAGTGDGEQGTVGTGDGDINHRLHTYYTNHFQPQLS